MSLFTSNYVLPIDFVRQQFPALDRYWAFFDNAGGTQILQQVINHIHDYWLNSNVQLGAPYALSQQANERTGVALEAIATLMNAADPSEVVVGSSASLLFRILALCLSQTWQVGDEVIVTSCDHLANISPWLALQRQGLRVKTWAIDPETLTLNLADLEALLSDRTRLVAFTHVSNILGTINPIQQITELVHQYGALTCVDGVAYAPHRLMDVQRWDVDFYTFSCYKIYGPHQAVLYGKRQYLEAMPGFNASVVTSVPAKFQPGGIDCGSTYGMLGLCEYLAELAKPIGDASKHLRGCMEQSFELIAEYETALSDRLLTFLTRQANIRIIGLPQADGEKRVSTISFAIEGIDSATIPARLATHNIGLRSGYFHNSQGLVQALALEKYNGVVRISMVHYNTLEEVDRLIDQLEAIVLDHPG